MHLSLRLYIYKYGSHSLSPATCPHPQPPIPHPPPSTSQPSTSHPSPSHHHVETICYRNSLWIRPEFRYWFLLLFSMYTHCLKYFEPQFLHLYNGKSNILLIRLWWSWFRLYVSEAYFGARQGGNYCVLCLSVHSPPLSHRFLIYDDFPGSHSGHSWESSFKWRVESLATLLSGGGLYLFPSVGRTPWNCLGVKLYGLL